MSEPELRRLRYSFERVDEALQDAYDAIERHERGSHCRFDLDRFPEDELDLLRKLILKARPDEPASATALPGRA